MSEAKLRAYLKDRFRGYRDDIPTNADLTGMVDSLGLFELVDFVEQTFEVKIRMADFRPAHFTSIENILRFVTELKERDTSIYS